MALQFKSYISTAVGATETTVYTCPTGGSATAIGLSLANITTSNVTVSVRLQKTGPAFAHIVKNVVIPPGQSLAVAGGDQKIVLESNNTLRVTCNVASGVDVITSVTEIV